MIRRCTSPKDAAYAGYGGRGITVCKRWLNSFENFLADMGPRPQGVSIDRLNNDGNYTPFNCRWATPKQQANNQRRPPAASDEARANISAGLKRAYAEGRGPWQRRRMAAL